MTLRKSRPTILLTLLVSSVIASFGYGWQYSEPVPQWIWSSAHDPGHVPTTACYFRHVVRLPADMTGARIGIAADDAFEIYINGRKLGEGTNERGIVSLDASQHVRSGENLIAVKVLNRKGSTAGLALRLVASQPGDQRSPAVAVPTEPQPVRGKRESGDHSSVLPQSRNRVVRQDPNGRSVSLPDALSV